MVKISSQFSNLVLVLIAIQVTQNHARRITSEVKYVNSNVTTARHQKVNDVMVRNTDIGSSSLDKSQALSRDLDARQTDTSTDKYSYFFVGSWIWHIPLWFTLWFSFYVAFNVVRAINGHTVINSLPFKP